MPGGIYELRIYVTQPGKLASFDTHFREHRVRLFERHGINNVACWTPQDRPDADNMLITLVHHASRKQADANWKALSSDPEWQDLAQASQVDGKLLVKPPVGVFLKALDYSPLK